MNLSTSNITSGLIWKMFERAVIQVLSFALSIWIVRIVTTDAYGIVTIVTAIVDTLSVFINGGLGSALIQDVDANKDDFTTVFFINLFLALLLYVALFFLSPLIAYYYEITEICIVLRIHSITLIISCFYQIQVNYCDKNIGFKKEFISSLIGIIISGSVSIALAYMGYGIWSLIVQGLLNITISGIVLAFENNYFPNIFRIKKLSRNNSSSGINFIFTDFISTIFNNLNSFIIGKKYSASALAYYDKGSYIPGLINTNVNTIISSVYYPNISLEKDDNVIKSILKETIEMETYVMSPIYLGLIAVANNLIEVIMTEKWLSSSIYVIIFSVGGLFTTIGPIDVAILKAKGRSDSLIKMEFIKKPIRLLLTLISLKFGIISLACVCALTELIDTIINSYTLNKMINFTFKDRIKAWIKSFLPSIPMFVIVSFLNKLNINSFYILVLQVATGILVFVLISKYSNNKSFNKIIELINNSFANVGKNE